MQKTFSRVVIERDPEAGPGNYTVTGLPEGRDFRKVDNYEEIRAQWLKVEGVAFAAQSAEFGEYKTLITVTQETEAGGLEITFEEME